MTKGRRLQLNPEPLRVVPAEERGRGALVSFLEAASGRTREQRRRDWIMLGEDPAIFDEDYPEE